MNVLVVGGGPAGSAAAITLARGGSSPRLIERSTGEHDVVCGGFLGWDSLDLLRRLGLDPMVLGARPIARLRLVSGRRVVEAALPYRAAGLSRRRLDAALLAAAVDAGAVVSRGVAVRSVEAGGRLRLQTGEELDCQALFLATGKHELRGAPRPLGRHRARLAIGLRTVLPASPTRTAALAEVIELHPFDGGYAGLLLQEDGAANLCLSVSQPRLAEAGTPRTLLAALASELPLLAERIGPDVPEQISAIAGVPYGWRMPGTEPGRFRIGDQGAVIASLAGDGIAMALAGGLSAAEALLAHGPAAAPEWQRRFRRRSRRPLAIAEALRRGAEWSPSREALMTLLKFAPGLSGIAASLTRIA